MVNVPNSDWLRARAKDRRAEGWEISDPIVPDEMDALADQLDRLETARMMRDAFKFENEKLREKLATVHRLACEASAHFANQRPEKAASTVALAIRVGA